MWKLMVLLASIGSCAAPKPQATFSGQASPTWLSFDIDLPHDRDAGDVLRSFEASARSFGCRTERIGESGHMAGGGEVRLSYGISADCDDGSIALVALPQSRLRIGCERPSTRERCEALLPKISDARR